MLKFINDTGEDVKLVLSPKQGEDSTIEVDAKGNKGYRKNGRGAWSSSAKILKDNNVAKRVKSIKKVVVVDAKIYNYALKETQKHFKDFADAGYTKDDGETLRRDLQRAYRIDKKSGISYNSETGDIRVEVVAGLGKSRKRFRIVWRIDGGDNKAQFITGYRNESEVLV